MDTSPIFKLVRAVDKAYLDLCRPVLAEFEFSQVAFDILMFLHNNPDCCTAKDISEKRNIKPNVISMYVEKLVNDGYLVRKSFAGDRRKIKLVCTQKAQAVVAKGEELQKDFVKRLSAGIPESDLQVFRSCIRNITQNAEGMWEK